jgi:hypothetical protein
MKLNSPTFLCLLLAGLTPAGCTQKPVTTVKPLGGPYYEELTEIPGRFPPLMEPGNNNRLRYIYVNLGRTNEITRYLGGFADSVSRKFDYRIYGPNFVYVERIDGSWSKFRLRAYSAQHGNITVDDNFGNYWKVIADEHGITCHRYQDGQERDDPQPVVYTAEHLSAL